MRARCSREALLPLTVASASTAVAPLHALGSTTGGGLLYLPLCLTLLAVHLAAGVAVDTEKFRRRYVTIGWGSRGARSRDIDAALHLRVRQTTQLMSAEANSPHPQGSETKLEESLHRLPLLRRACRS